MLRDKSFYDYDYEHKEPKRQVTEAELEVWSDDRVAKMLSRAINPSTGARVFEPEAEAMQRRIMEDKVQITKQSK